MDGLSTKDLVGVVLGIIFLAVIVFARFGSRPRVPKDKFFNCWRCKALTLHNRRTIKAWRNDKTRLFCDVCHREWWRSHPARTDRPRHNAITTLVAVAIMTVIALLAHSCT
jgi:hypothetical protein